jgi:hypothetical protein
MESESLLPYSQAPSIWFQPETYILSTPFQLSYELF